MITVSGRGLRVTKDPNRQLSVRCSLLMSSSPENNFFEVDRTEFQDDCLNPDWDKQFVIGYKFSDTSILRFDIALSLDKIGETKISLTDLLSSKDGFTLKAIKSENEKIGKLLIRFKEVEINKETIQLQFSGKELDKKDLFGLSDPYFVLSNIDRNGNLTEVYKSEVIKQSICPVWRPFKVRAKTLCFSDKTMRLQFDCYDWDSDLKIELKEKLDFIGSFETTLEKLLKGPLEDNVYELINPSKLAKNLDSYKNSGVICLDAISEVLDDSFLDHIRDGLQFHANIAIDFTAALTNRQVSESYDNPSLDSDIYMSFVKNIHKILNQYNYQNLWTISGFNAILTDNITDYHYSGTQDCKTLEDMSSRFENLLKNARTLTSKGQTNRVINLEPMVNDTVEWVERLVATDPNRKCRYSILFVLTSNLCKDTIRNLDYMINKSCGTPISIVIIDVNFNGNHKEIQEIRRLMNNKKKLDNRNNIEVMRRMRHHIVIKFFIAFTNVIQN